MRLMNCLVRESTSPVKSGQQVDDNQSVRLVNLEKHAVSTDGTIRIKCPSIDCLRVLAVPSHTRGKLVRCRKCGTIVRIPAAKQKPEQPIAPEENAA